MMVLVLSILKHFWERSTTEGWRGGITNGNIMTGSCYQSYPRWWFQITFIFTPKLGEDLKIWGPYFSDGLKPQPPTTNPWKGIISKGICFFFPIIIFFQGIFEYIWYLLVFVFFKNRVKHLYEVRYELQCGHNWRLRGVGVFGKKRPKKCLTFCRKKCRKLDDFCWCFRADIPWN